MLQDQMEFGGQAYSSGRPDAKPIRPEPSAVPGGYGAQTVVMSRNLSEALSGAPAPDCNKIPNNDLDSCSTD